MDDPERFARETGRNEPREAGQPKGAAGRTQSKLTWIIPLALAGILVTLYFAWPAFHSLANEAYAAVSSGEQKRIEAWVAQFGVWGFVVILVLMLVQSLLAFIPSLLMMVVAVLSYGPVLGGFLAWGGLMLAASMAYAIGGLLGPVTVDRLIGGETQQKIGRFVDRYGVWAVVAARLSPALSTDAVSYAAGLAGMGFVRFISATALGTIPLTVAVAYLGARMDRLTSGLIWISIITAALFIGYVAYDWRKRRG